MSQELEGKLAVVTGASKGIGAAIARHLAAAGAAVVVNYASSKEGAEKVVTEIISAGGKAVALKANVRNRAESYALIAGAVREFGPIDILVNNAGVYDFVELDKIDEEHFRKMFDLNVFGLLMTTQAAVRNFNPAGGSIINVSSLGSTFIIPGTSVYSGTKAAVDVITRVLSKELGPKKIRVNCVNPGLVETEGTANYMETDFHDMMKTQTPLGRVGKPDDIAKAVLFLASDDSGWVNGDSIKVSGGQS
jgi:3-oxoacyl-[acyl-carrier protein] reductase